MCAPDTVPLDFDPAPPPPEQAAYFKDADAYQGILRILRCLDRIARENEMGDPAHSHYAIPSGIWVATVGAVLKGLDPRIDLSTVFVWGADFYGTKGGAARGGGTTPRG